MTYRRILLHVDSGPARVARTAVAARLAIEHDAQLVVLAPTDPVSVPGDPSALIGAAADTVERALGDSMSRAQRALDAARTQLTEAGVTPIAARVDGRDHAVAVVEAALTADLVVLGQPHAASEPRLTGLAPEVLLHAGRPVLLMPHIAEAQASVGTRVLVGWNASRACARAIADALPILRRAKQVDVVRFEKPAVGVEFRADGFGGLDDWLASHGVRAKLEAVPSEIGVADALLSRAADGGHDLVVMGGYGHSRFREALLGGATRSVLKQMTVAVLMSH